MKLSYSQMSEFTNCKLKFYYSYIKQLKPTVTPAYLEKGVAYHQLIENFLKHNDSKIDEVVSQYKCVQKSDLENAFNLFLDLYNNDLKGNFCESEKWMSYTYPDRDLTLVSRIDLEVRSGKDIIIYDFKTGSNYSTNQALFYLLIYSKHKIFNTAFKFFLPMKTNYNSYKDALVSLEINSEKLREFEKKVFDVAESIANYDWSDPSNIEPTYNNLCHYCSYGGTNYCPLSKSKGVVPLRGIDFYTAKK